MTAAVLDETRLRQAAQVVLDQNLSGKRACLSIVVADADLLRQLNRRFRNNDAATDVLSFAAPALPEEINDNERYLGDVVLAYDYVELQANKRGTSFAETLSLLVVHGTLHLLGYEHDTHAVYERMWEAQEQALNALGIKNNVVRAYELAQSA